MSIVAPAVSVFIPAYNGQKTITKTLSSVISQKYRSLEIIVLNDGSKDSTTQIVQDFMSTSGFLGNFVLVNHEKNWGLSRTLNDGISRANGDFVLVLHQDCELIGESWVSTALSFMADKRVAIVTGYYGVSDQQDETFIKRSFGLLRKQFHAKCQIDVEEATFSEGKCDLYRKEYLVKAGNFPTGYRIAGEDLIVSYNLRKIGYKILKSYNLPVIQRFTGAAETFTGNLGKEFLFGKVMGGVFSKFKAFLFKGVGNAKYSGSRSLHRASQPVFTLAFLLALLLTVFFWWFSFIAVGLVLFRYLYYINRTIGELKTRVEHPQLESLIVSFIGILTDFSYTFGFGYGLVRHSLGRSL
jgi:glycosyltransferase involved in cell wall biosynthesis